MLHLSVSHSFLIGLSTFPSALTQGWISANTPKGHQHHRGPYSAHPVLSQDQAHCEMQPTPLVFSLFSTQRRLKAAEPLRCVSVECLGARGRASVPSPTCLPERAITSDQQLKISDGKQQLHIIMNFLFIAPAVLGPSFRRLTFSRG